MEKVKAFFKSLFIVLIFASTVNAQELMSLCQYTQVSCSCSATYPKGTVVTLTATPDPGSVFMGWSGDCVGTQRTCTVVMDKDRSVIARFDKKLAAPKWRRSIGGNL